MIMKIRRIISAVLICVTVFLLSACADTASGEKNTDTFTIRSDSPYAGRENDLSKRKTIVMYVLGDEPTDMQKIADKANAEYFEPDLNTTVEIKFLNWSDYATKYSLLLSGGEQVDLIYTAAWCYYNEEAAKGAFLELTKEFLEENMPETYKEQPKESWEQISINGKIYAVPKAKATFTGYNIAIVRQDLIEKYKLTVPDSWENYLKYLEELAALKSETGVNTS